MSAAPSRIIARAVFDRLAELADYPAVAGIPSGGAAWEDFCGRSTPVDRRRVVDDLVPGFTDELIATAAAEQHLREWFEAGPRGPHAATCV